MQRTITLFWLILLVLPLMAQKAPTLGFNTLKFKDGSHLDPVMDFDAWTEEQELKKQLPGNQFLGDKLGFHDMALMNEFLDAFKAVKECNGITLFIDETRHPDPDFTVRMQISGHDDHPKDQTWTWMLAYPHDPSPKNTKDHGVGGLGVQSTAKLTARDVCLTVWDDVDPNHFKKGGGRVE